VKVTADGSLQLARLVQSGERLEIEAATLLQVEVGDAGAFAYALDGKPGRPLGSSGRVARVRIDRSNAAGFVAQ
jgi:ribosome biogenesis SPOUT family RNA methylase Rps3